MPTETTIKLDDYLLAMRRAMRDVGTPWEIIDGISDAQLMITMANDESMLRLRISRAQVDALVP